MNAIVSIIVPCRNERTCIRSFLEGLTRQDFTGILPEVLIADGQSDDGTREIVREYALSLQWIRLVDNPRQFVSTGLNLALREATGDIVIRMDVHSEYATNYVRECVCALVETGAQNVGGPALTKSHGYIGGAIAAAYASPFSCGGPRFHNRSYEGYVDTVPYGCWYRRTLEELKGFDENLVRNQDDELNLRILRAGGKIWMTPKIKSWYRPRSNLMALALQYFQYGYWKVAVIRKHSLPASFRHLVPPVFVLFAILGGLASAFSLAESWSVVIRLYLTGLSVYMVCNVVASLRATLGRLALFPAVLIIFPIYHLSYGAGFLTASLRSVRACQGHHGPSSFAERLSR